MTLFLVKNILSLFNDVTFDDVANDVTYDANFLKLAVKIPRPPAVKMQIF